MKFLQVIALLLFLTPVFSQVEIHGVTVDSATLMPVPFVNIGIPGKNMGTVSNSKGEFKLSLPGKKREGTLKFTSIGYRDLEMPIAELSSNEGKLQVFYMTPHSIEIEEIVVTDREWKEKTVGAKRDGKFITAGFVGGQLGQEFGLRIKVKKATSSYGIPYGDPPKHQSFDEIQTQLLQCSRWASRGKNYQRKHHF